MCILEQQKQHKTNTDGLYSETSTNISGMKFCLNNRLFMKTEKTEKYKTGGNGNFRRMKMNIFVKDNMWENTN